MKPIFLLGGALLVASPSFAQNQSRTSPPLLRRADSGAAQLPLKSVVLFSSGVGYFGRSGQVDGDASVDLNVRAPQISDILKSLVLFDPKGHVDPVTYSIQDYLAARPTSTDLNIDPSSSPGAILKMMQGARVRIERPSGTIEGRVVAVSTQQIKDGDTLRTVESATILTTSGLQTVRLDDVTSFVPLDPSLADKFAQSLDKDARGLTQTLDNGVRPVTLHFRGRGRRDVRAGYLLESPAWKTSYRLVLGDGQKPYLQGWAVVENPSDEDWQDVNLSLVSGRPVSFIQDLATPVYIVRPVVQPQIIGSPTPQTFGAGFGDDDAARQNPRLDASDPRNTALDNRVPARLRLAPGSGGAFMARRGQIFSNSGAIGGGLAYDAPAAPLAEAASSAQTALQNKVEAQASGAQQGNLFVYAIDSKVSIPRGQAAMVPIVGQDIDGEAVTIVQSQGNIGELASQNGFCLRNHSGLNFQGGPITVVNDGIYGGDALISNVSPGEARLLAYAVDLDLVSRLDGSPEEREIVAIAPTQGGITLTRRAKRTQNYVFRNKSDKAKVVYLQQPNEDAWKLVDSKQLYEKSNDGLRFRVEVPAKKTINYAIKWKKDEYEAIGLSDLNPDQIGVYVGEQTLAPALKQQLQAIIALKKRANDLAGQRVAQEKKLSDITEGQARIRENMKALDRTSALYRSYETKLSAQEGQIDRLQADVDRLRDAENAAKQDVANAIAKLGEDK